MGRLDTYYGVDWLNAKWFGAAGDGRTDDTAAIQATLDAAKAAGGATVYLPALTYVISAPLTLPLGVTLRGSLGGKQYLSGSQIRLSAGFSGTGAIILPAGSYENRVERLDIDGSLADAGTVHGIYFDCSTDDVSFAAIEKVLIRGAGIKDGVNCTSGTSGAPLEPHLTDVTVYSVGNNGFSLANATDAFITNCHAISCGSLGWYLSALADSQMTGCRAAENTSDGFYLTGSWGTGTGSGGMVMTGCCTDRNSAHGVLVDATGNGPILINGLMTRRDGKSSTSGGYAGLCVSGATAPVIVNGFTCYPGVNDDGTGNDSPEYGISITSSPAYVAVTNAFCHGVTAGVNGTITNSRAVTTRTGSTSSPGSITQATDSA